MKILIAVTSCAMHRDRNQAIRDTWGAGSAHDIRFFIGGESIMEDEVGLKCPDDYASLPRKTKAMCAWAVDAGYDYVFKVDSDVYVATDRLEVPLGHDYSGRVRGAIPGFPAPYCSGFSYWLSKKAMSILAAARITHNPAEDSWVGNTLLEHGINAHPDYRYVVVKAKMAATSGKEGPRRGNDVISSCEYEPVEMASVHEQYLHTPSSLCPPEEFIGEFSKICIMIKTMLRDTQLFRTISGIEKHLPGARMIIVDDGRDNPPKITEYARLRTAGHSCVWMPEDSGFGAKSNESLRHMDREYLLVASDDFDFHDVGVIESVRRMIRLLDHEKSLSVASGRVNGNPYEGNLTIRGDECWERYIDFKDKRLTAGVEWYPCDLTVNFSLIRSSILGWGEGQVHWHDDVKIGGGEHGAFFIALLRSGHKVAYVAGANINEQRIASSPEYMMRRARARGAGRICLKREGINKYHTFGGHIEIC